MKIAVVALGKIGLPLAVQFADADPSHEVVGVDVNPRVVELVNAGTEPFPGEAHLADKLAQLVPAGRLRATTDYGDAIPGADAVVLVVPLFVDEATGAPDFGWMDQATRSLAQHLTPGTLVSYETTLPVGTTRNADQIIADAASRAKPRTVSFARISPEYFEVIGTRLLRGLPHASGTDDCRPLGLRARDEQRPLGRRRRLG